MATSSIYVLRTYHAAPGRLDDLISRFRDHTVRLIERHGLKVEGFFVATDTEDVLVYLLSGESREAADRDWAAFQHDPEWLEAKRASEVNGVLVESVESMYLSPTDLSLLR